MKTFKTKTLPDYEHFRIGNTIHLKGGGEGEGVVTGSRVDSGRNYLDVDFESGSTWCNHDMGTDGAHDEGYLIGGPFLDLNP